MKKNYFVSNVDGEHEYTITIEDTDDGVLTTLYRSKSTVWSESIRGEFILSMLNTGDGVKLNKKFKKLDYSELFELRLLLNFENKCDTDLNRDSYIVNEVNLFFEV
jgi:hypothetical protein